MDVEIEKRIAKAAENFGKLNSRVWSRRELEDSTKLSVYRACILSVLLYGAATWTTYKKHLQKLESFHHRCLRKILKVSWSDFVPTTEVLTRAKMSSIESFIITMRLKWIGHVRRMPDERLPKKMLNSMLAEGVRVRGKPAKRWKDVIKGDMKDYGIDQKNWWTLSAKENKSKWRSHIFKAEKKWEKNRTRKLEEKRKARKKKQAEREERERKEGVIGKHKCDTCGRSYTTRSALFLHTRKIHPEVKPALECKACKRKFTSRSGLSRHICKHMNDNLSSIKNHTST